MLPLLYLHGLPSGDFVPALEQFLGSSAGLSPATVTRLAAQWQADHKAFGERDLSATDYVYVWADGIQLRIRLEEAKAGVLVVMGVRADGSKELIAMADGYLESSESWASLLRDCQRRGLRAPVLAVGDGALGFWNAVSEVFPTPADSEFCFDLHKAAMGDYVAAVRGWDEADQRDYHERHFDPDRWQIITINGTDAGILTVEYSATEVYLGRIELHPRYQGRGIGTHPLIQSLIDTAAKRDQDLMLDVLAVNTGAHAFYERHGFREVARHGENNHKIRMCFPRQQAEE
ncbi:Acetyltransferase (GNAT) family protein [Streptomyces sp. OV198]|nr:Acetyltransferase (GNAT) family protein [Streptomyces sp. OV198]